jgi:hypothetical protein
MLTVKRPIEVIKMTATLLLKESQRILVAPALPFAIDAGDTCSGTSGGHGCVVCRS